MSKGFRPYTQATIKRMMKAANDGKGWPEGLTKLFKLFCGIPEEQMFNISSCVHEEIESYPAEDIERWLRLHKISFDDMEIDPDNAYIENLGSFVFGRLFAPGRRNWQEKQAKKEKVVHE